MLYAIESISLSNAQLQQINSWWNSIFRSIFNYPKWESAKELIFYLQRIDLRHTILMRRLLFIKKNIDRNCTNHLMHDIMNKYVHEPECISLCKKSKVVFDYSKDTIK